jgi:hypothetical protein
MKHEYSKEFKAGGGSCQASQVLGAIAEGVVERAIQWRGGP